MTYQIIPLKEAFESLYDGLLFTSYSDSEREEPDIKETFLLSLSVAEEECDVCVISLPEPVTENGMESYFNMDVDNEFFVLDFFVSRKEDALYFVTPSILPDGTKTEEKMDQIEEWLTDLMDYSRE